jgi:hypothetical protein
VRPDHWQLPIAQPDSDVDFAEIYRIRAAREFPWDMAQALGLARFRTYAAPSIGELLADTGLILEAVLEHGDPDGYRVEELGTFP